MSKKGEAVAADTNAEVEDFLPEFDETPVEEEQVVVEEPPTDTQVVEDEKSDEEKLAEWHSAGVAEAVREQEARVNQQWEEKERGLLRTISELRGRAREHVAPPGGAAASPGASAPAAGMPDLRVHFDDDGQPYVPGAAVESVMAARSRNQPQDPTHQLQQIRQDSIVRMVSQDPNNAPYVHRYWSVFDEVDQATRSAQAQSGANPFQTVEEAMEFVEKTGVADAYVTKYPDLFSDKYKVLDFIEAGTRLDMRKVGRVVSWMRGVENGQNAPVALAPQRVVERIDPSKPRPMADRGHAPNEKVVGKEQRIKQLEDMDPMDMSDDEMKEFESLINVP